jgi:hypothetical protein
MSTDSMRKITGVRAVAVLVLLIVSATLLWWVNTVLAMILVFAALFVVTLTLCTIPIDSPARPARRAMSRTSPWRFVPLEEIVEKQEEFFEILEKYEEDVDDGAFTIPVGGMKGLSESLPHELPVEIVVGIDEVCGQSLRSHGIGDLLQLAEANVDEVAMACSVSKADAARWVFEAIGIVKGAGITSSMELAMSKPGELLIRINEAIEEGRIEVTDNKEYSEKTLRYWIRAAKRTVMLTSDDLKRLRDRK